VLHYVEVQEQIPYSNFASLRYFLQVTGVMTQGRGDRDEWVTHYTLSYSQDAFRWSFVNDPYGNKRVSFDVIVTTGGCAELDKCLVLWPRINLLYDDEISIKPWRNDDRQRTHNLFQCQYVHPISYMACLRT